MPAIGRVLLVLVLAGLLLGPRIGAAAPGFTQSCESAMAKEQIDELLERMRAISAAGPCALERLDTSMFRTLIVWRRGDAVHEILLGPRGCVLEPTHEGAALAFHASNELGEACPAALAGVREFVGEPQVDLLPVVRGQAPEIPEDPDAVGVGDPLVIASAAWLAALLLAGVAGAKHWRRSRADAAAGRFALVLAGMFMLALVLRFSVVASLGNWYGGFLPASGELGELGELRFGASSSVLQAVLRAVSPWTVEVAFALVRVTGALAIPLVMLLVRRLGGSMSACLIAGLLLAFAPIAVRLSASSSEHVLAGTLALAAWAVWLRSASDPSLVPRALSLVLVVLAVLTRVDCWPQLSLIPLWTLLARGPDDGWRPLRSRLLDALGFWLGWALLGVYAWFHVVLPSNHPGPDPAGMRATIEVLFSQLWVAASEPPRWLSPVCFALLVFGTIAAAIAKRFGLLLAAVMSLALIFVPLGRNLTHDGLTGARYFVLALPLLVVVAGQTGDVLERLSLELPSVWRRPLLISALAVLALCEGLAVRPAWRHEYTFQAEYLVLAEQLSAARASGHELDGCTLWFVSPRQATGEPDLDCCLAPDRSPLTLLAPGLRMRPFPHNRPPDDASGCQLYYYGSLCSIDPELAPRVPEGLARIRTQCEALRTRGGTDVIDRREVTDANLQMRWRSPPLVELFGRFE